MDFYSLTFEDPLNTLIVDPDQKQLYKVTTSGNPQVTVIKSLDSSRTDSIIDWHSKAGVVSVGVHPIKMHKGGLLTSYVSLPLRFMVIES